MNIVNLVNEWATENDKFPFVECCAEDDHHYCYFSSMAEVTGLPMAHWPCMSFGLAKNRSISVQAFPKWESIYVSPNFARINPVTPVTIRFDDPEFFNRLMNYFDEVLDE
jgi:hypothetical protein